jgi:hypothetical protein
LDGGEDVVLAKKLNEAYGGWSERMHEQTRGVSMTFRTPYKK